MTPLALIVLVIAGAPDPTPTPTATCARSAEVVRGEVFASVSSGSERPVARLVRGRRYFSVRAARVEFGGARYATGAQTTFALRCEGRRAAVEVIEGRVSLTAAARRPALLAAREGTVEAGISGAQVASLRRVANLVDLGTTTIRRVGGSGPLTITPLVGPRPGAARRARGATLRSTGRDADGALEGASGFVGSIR